MDDRGAHLLEGMIDTLLASALRLEERVRDMARVVDGETDGEDEVNDRNAIDSKAPHLHKAEKRKGVRGKGVVRGMCVGVVAMCVLICTCIRPRMSQSTSTTHNITRSVAVKLANTSVTMIVTATRARPKLVRASLRMIAYCS